MKKKEQLQQLFDTFKKEAKEIIDSVDDKPKVGEWWITTNYDSDDDIFCVQAIKGIDQYIGLGISGTRIRNNDFCIREYLIRKATPSEIEEGLRRVCEKMYAKGTRFRYKGQIYTSTAKFWFGRDNMHCTVDLTERGVGRCSDPCLFKDGKFAEIVEEEEPIKIMGHDVEIDKDKTIVRIGCEGIRADIIKDLAAYMERYDLKLKKYFPEDFQSSTDLTDSIIKLAKKL